MSDSEPIGVLEGVMLHLAETTLPLEMNDAASVRRRADHVRAQVADHILPRVNSLDAPLLAVVGGSTGAGKSTLVNALVGKAISRSGAIRPTTRQPVLVHHPEDAAWFEGTRILPSLPRVALVEGPDVEADRGTGMGSALHVVSSEHIPRGIAIVDAPDIDSVSEDNRELAGQLLRAADLWIFVTTAHRYADAVPWGVLGEAVHSDITLAVVMNRIPDQPGVREELGEHLRSMLDERGVRIEHLFLIPEVALAAGELLDSAPVHELKSWIDALARDASARGAIARRTVAGALGQTVRALEDIGRAVAEQQQERERVSMLARAEFDAAREHIDELTKDGALLRGEVLARWQDVVGTGEFFRGVQGWVSRMRDRIGAAMAGRTAPVVAAESAIETGLVSVVVDQVAHARARTLRQWLSRPSAAALLEADPAMHRSLAASAPSFTREVEDQVRSWQRDVLALVQQEGADRRTKARVYSLGVNVLGIALMVVVFASTAFIPTGLEIGAGAATAVVGQKLLESIFGDEAVRRLAATARTRLDERISMLVDSQAKDFEDFLARTPIVTSSQTLREDAQRVRLLARQVGDAGDVLDHLGEGDGGEQ